MVATLSSFNAWELILLVALSGLVVFLISSLFPRVDIVSLELAGSASRAKAIVDAWSREGLLGAARRNVFLDFPFLVAYSTLLALAVVLVERGATSSGFISTDAGEVGIAFVLAAFAAGVCDAVENGALLGMLSKDAEITQVRARVATGFAVAKFALVVVALGWIVSTPVASLVSWVG